MTGKILDDEDFRETCKINHIYKTEGFIGVINYANDNIEIRLKGDDLIEKRYSLWKCNDYKNGVKDNSENAYYLDEEVVDLLNSLIDETKKLEKENLDLSEELDYYKAKCASLETGLFQAERETEQLRKENKELQGKASSWKITASEQIMEQSKLIKENEQLKQRINSRLHFYRELYESTNDNVVKRVIEDLEDILR